MSTETKEVIHGNLNAIVAGLSDRQRALLLHFLMGYCCIDEDFWNGVALGIVHVTPAGEVK